MKNYEASKIDRPFLLFLIVSFLMFAHPSVSKSQSNTAPDLEGTEWLVSTVNLYPTASIVPPQMGYLFEGQGIVTIIIDSDPYDSDPVGIPRVRTSARGTYSQRGNFVRIEFSDHIIEAQIDGNKLIGEFTRKALGEKASWSAVRSLANNGNSSGRTTSDKTDSSGSYSVAASNPLLGVWKYTEYTGGINSGGIKIPPSVSKIKTLTFYQSGVFDFKQESAFVGATSFANVNDKLNWKYIPQTDSTGVLEQYKGNKLVNRSIVRWISNNQFEIASAAAANGIRNTFTREGNNLNSFRSLVESVNATSLLSMKERLPAQLGQFKRESLSTGCNEDALDPIFRLCKDGVVDHALAQYTSTSNEPIIVTIFKYEDPSIAAKSMGEIGKLILQRQPVQNHAGQTVGVLLQYPHGNGQVIVFTFGAYYYHLYSPTRGGVQTLQRLLPLE